MDFAPPVHAVCIYTGIFFLPPGGGIAGRLDISTHHHQPGDQFDENAELSKS